MEATHMTDIAHLTQDAFEESIASETPTLVDFWAEWCAPCRAIAPILEEIAVSHDGRIVIRKLNVDENPDITQRYGVMSIPTLILFAGGEEKARITGARAKEQLLKDIEPHL
jgi:thioredoxin 1